MRANQRVTNEARDKPVSARTSAVAKRSPGSLHAQGRYALSLFEVVHVYEAWFEVAVAGMEHGTGAVTSGSAGAGREQYADKAEGNGTTGSQASTLEYAGLAAAAPSEYRATVKSRRVLAADVGSTRREVTSAPNSLKLSLYEDEGDTELRGLIDSGISSRGKALSDMCCRRVFFTEGVELAHKLS